MTTASLAMKQGLHRRLGRVVAALLPLALSACGGGSAGSAAPPAAAAAQSAWTNFSGARAMEDVRAQVEIGPRPSGSERIEKARVHIEKRLAAAGWETRRDAFTATAPVRGPVNFINVRARFPVAGTDTWQRPVTVLAGSHYDTKWVTQFLFVGANDAGSSTGLLLEAARALAPLPGVAGAVELIFLDGEEAFVDFTQPLGFDDRAYDGLFGSRHHAASLRSLPPAARPRAFVLFDMIGDQNLEVEFPPNGSPRLAAMGIEAARQLGFARHFAKGTEEMVDDHVPFSWIGMEVIDFIDFNSYRRAGYWHTAGDTLDKLSPDSIEMAGRTGLVLIERLVREASP